MSWKGKNRTYRLFYSYEDYSSSTALLFASSSSPLRSIAILLDDWTEPAGLCFVPRVISCGILWGPVVNGPKMATACRSVASLPQLHRLHLTWWRFSPNRTSYLSAVARSSLEFFICVFLEVQAWLSTRRCFWLHSASLRATSFVVCVHCRHVVSGHAAIRAFKQNAVSSVLWQKLIAVSRWTSTYSRKTSVVACQLRKVKQWGSSPITTLFRLFVVISALSTLLPSALAIRYAG